MTDMSDGERLVSAFTQKHTPPGTTWMRMQRWHFEEIARDVDALVAQRVVEEREAIAISVRAHAERLKHTSHRDGLGMGWQAGEFLCEELAATIRRRGEER